jgi:hypothetical protein
MGLNLFGSSCASCRTSVQEPRPNPNPRNFKITDITSVGKYVIAKVHYPDCTNFEGNKILVFYNTTVGEVMRQGVLDPHFCEERHLSPIARFVPTPEGLVMAMKFCKANTDLT